MNNETQFKIRYWVLFAVHFAISFLVLVDNMFVKAAAFLWFFVLTRIYVDKVVKDYALELTKEDQVVTSPSSVKLMDSSSSSDKSE